MKEKKTKQPLHNQAFQNTCVKKIIYSVKIILNAEEVG